jgi:hypothetical protein
MSRQEYEALQSQLAQLVEIRGVMEDPEANLLIREAVTRQPDATCLPVQRTQLLRERLEEVRSREEFLGNSKSSVDRRDLLPRERWRAWLGHLSTRRRRLQDARSDDYTTARAHAIKWLGNRYLLAIPVRKRDPSRT